MNPFQPTVAKLSFQWPTSEFQPGLIEVVAQFVWTGHPDHHWSSISDQSEAFFALAYCVLGLVALGDVHCHPKHARWIPVVFVMELPSGSDPAHRSIRANDTKFRCVRFPVSFSISDRLLDKFPVFWVYRTSKVLSLSGIVVRFDSKHGLQIAEPTVDASLGIPLPSHRFPSLHCETHPVITDCQLSFCGSSSRVLPKQRDNEQGLKQDQSNTAS